MAVNMADYITPDRSMSEMYMLREANKDAIFLFVEGKDDIKFVSRLVRPEVYVGFCKGKSKVYELMRKVETSRLRNVVAVVDKDYDEILKNTVNIDSVFYTDGTDMESSILMSKKAIQKMMIEFSDSERVEKYNNSHIPELVDKVFEICEQVGKMRLTNQKYDIGLKFKSTDITVYIDGEMNFDFDQYQNDVIEHSGKSGNTDSVKSRIRGELVNNYEYWEICRGHDLVKVFQYVLSSAYNCLSYGNEAFSEKELSRFLRGSYEEQWFKKTSIYFSLKNWQARKHVELLAAG